MKKPILFDLDGTLAKSKSALDTEMAVLLQDPHATKRMIEAISACLDRLQPTHPEALAGGLEPTIKGKTYA